MTNIDVLHDKYFQTRQQTLRLCEPLAYDDYLVQSADFVSPPKWHLAHATWFFETFVLVPYVNEYREFGRDFRYLFNSYYKAVGEHLPRPKRGCVSRPTLDQVKDYRRYVDSAMAELLKHPAEETARIIQLGIEHEKQHQELLLMDVKHIWFQNQNPPNFFPSTDRTSFEKLPLSFVDFPGGIFEVGHQDESFCFDNELPSHQVLLRPFSLGSRPVTNGEFLEFLKAGGYRKPSLWLSDGWDLVQSEKWIAPQYWYEDGNEWKQFTLWGAHQIDLNAPVCHVSGYEADAYARWAGARLPTEFEWETAFKAASEQLRLSGHVWEWTSSAYSAYPGYRATSDALGEYNGKFMVNQWVLRGGASVTPPHHSRLTYRNFFHPHMRWQFSGIRLAKDAQ